MMYNPIICEENLDYWLIATKVVHCYGSLSAGYVNLENFNYFHVETEPYYRNNNKMPIL